MTDSFFREAPGGETACGDTGYFLRMEFERDGNTLLLRHATKEISRNTNPKEAILCFCSSGSRPLTTEELKVHGDDICLNAVLWAVSWSTGDEAADIDGLGSKREFLNRFFHYYQRVAGIGCHVNGQIRKAVVEVAFGTAWYGVNH